MRRSIKNGGYTKDWDCWRLKPNNLMILNVLEPTWANTCLSFRAQSFWWFWFWTCWICGTRIQPDVGQQVLWGLTFFRDPVKKPLGFHQQIGAGIIKYNRQKGELQTISWHLLWDIMGRLSQKIVNGRRWFVRPFWWWSGPKARVLAVSLHADVSGPGRDCTFASKLVTKNIPRPGFILRGTSAIIGVWSLDGKDSPSDLSCVANVCCC